MAESRSELATISALVPTLSIIGLFNFIHVAKQLKDDILLAQPAEEPEHQAPEVLPPSVADVTSFLARIHLGAKPCIRRTGV